MQTIAISINKGGVGKTTLTKSLATAATAAGLNVLVLDMDTQQNATSWWERRQKNGRPLPLVQFVTEHALAAELAKAEAAGCDLVVIDTPPGRNSEAPAAVEAANLVLVPFWNDQDSYDGVRRTAALARRLGKPAFGVLNFATPHSRAHADTAREVLEGIGLPMAGPVLHRYEAHRLANPRGLTAQEAEPESAAAADVAALWEWVCAQVPMGTRARVHKGKAA